MSHYKTDDLEDSVDKKKSDPKRTLRVGLIILLLLIIVALAALVLAKWPRYPDFEKSWHPMENLNQHYWKKKVRSLLI